VLEARGLLAKMKRKGFDGFATSYEKLK
jgi:hypothetical protein